MVSDTWFSEIESTIFTHLQYRLVERYQAPYPFLNCTISNQNASLENISDFPTLYIHLLPAAETGQDLTEETINAVRATFEMQIFSDVSEDDCRKMMATVIREMKALHFRISLFPDPQSRDKKYYAIARFNRLIASGDSDIVPKE